MQCMCECLGTIRAQKNTILARISLNSATHKGDKQPLHIGLCTIAFCIMKPADSALSSIRQTKLGTNLKACQAGKVKVSFLAQVVRRGW